MLDNRIVLLMSAAFFRTCRLMSTLLSRPYFRIISIKFSWDLTFIWWMYRDMDETSLFGSILWMIYITFSTLVSELTLQQAGMTITDLEPNIEYILGLPNNNGIRTHLSKQIIRIVCVNSKVLTMTPWQDLPGSWHCRHFVHPRALQRS